MLKELARWILGKEREKWEEFQKFLELSEEEKKVQKEIRKLEGENILSQLRNDQARIISEKLLIEKETELNSAKEEQETF